MGETSLLQQGSAAAAACARLGIVLILLLTFVGVDVARSDGPNQAALIVQHGNGDVKTFCIDFSEEEVSGYDVLERSGLDLKAEASGGAGMAICRIDNEGCNFPEKPCFCQCTGAGGSCEYWSYWHRKGGDWEYSGMGSSSHSVRNGDIEGWVWGPGTIDGASPPPDVEFGDICVPATPTATPTATDTPVPTDTPEPTNTPEPPTIAYFNAERTTINAGESVTLNWDLSDAKAAYLRYEEAEEGVVAPGSKTVSPSTTTVYTLIARNDGGETTAEVTINVIPVTDTPAPTDTPPATSMPVAAQAPPPSATPSPTSLVATEPDSTPSLIQPTDTPIPPAQPAEPTSTPLPPPSPMPTMTPTATSVPVPVAATTPGLSDQQEARPPTSPQETPQESGPGLLVVVLAAIGVIAMLSGLAGVLLLLLALRHGAR